MFPAGLLTPAADARQEHVSSRTGQAAARPAALPDGTLPASRPWCKGISALRLTDLCGMLRPVVWRPAVSSPGWKKWRHGTCLLPAPQNGISDITEMYLEAFGEPEPGRKVFIRTRQQRDGWEDKATDLSELVPLIPPAAQSRTGVPLARFPLPKPCRTLVPILAAHRLPNQPSALYLPSRRLIYTPCTRRRHHASAVAPPLQYHSAKAHPRSPRSLTPLR
jgi:hypothetical protein